MLPGPRDARGSDNRHGSVLAAPARHRSRRTCTSVAIILRNDGGAVTHSGVNPAQLEARRALVLHDRPLVVDLITLTLNHGVFAVRAANNLAEAEAILADWHPHMTVIDMDHDDSSALLQRLGASNTLRGSVDRRAGQEGCELRQTAAVELSTKTELH